MHGYINCSCIIPFYDEGINIRKLLEEISSHKSIDEIICVDDGSKPSLESILRNNKEKVKVITLKKNIGKAGAVYEGLKIAKGKYILLIDADLISFIPEEFGKMIELIKSDSSIGMIILRMEDPWFYKMIRMSIVFSGERILLKSDLTHIFDMKPERFQLEPAINKYMIKNKKKVLWMKSRSLKHRMKYLKFGIFAGTAGDIKMFFSLIKYLGIKDLIYQLATFSRNQITK